MALFDEKKPYRAPQGPAAPSVVNNQDAAIRRIGTRAPPDTRTQPGLGPDAGGRQSNDAPSNTRADMMPDFITNADGGYDPYKPNQNDPYNGTVTGPADPAEQATAGGVSDEVLNKIMGMIQGYDDEQATINASMDQKLSGNLRAMGGQLGASGFGASGAGVALSGDVARTNELARQGQLQDAESEFFKRLMGAQEAALGERGMVMDEAESDMINQLIMEQLDKGGDGGGGGGGAPGDGTLWDYLDEGTEAAGDFLGFDGEGGARSTRDNAAAAYEAANHVAAAANGNSSKLGSRGDLPSSAMGPVASHGGYDLYRDTVTGEYYYVPARG